MAKVLIVGDVHGNLPALSKVLEVARGWDEILVLGDLVDYGPYPGEVIDLLRSSGARIVRGNHDHAVAFGVDCRCSEATHWLSVWFREHITMRLLSRNDREFLGSLPFMVHLDVNPYSITAVHGAPRDPLYGYLYPWLSESKACSMLRKTVRLRSEEVPDKCGSSVFLVGHTHYQFYRIVHGSIVVNPGSLGQPRDGDPRASFAVFDDYTGSFSFYRVKYEIDKVVKGLSKLGIPDPYMSALKYIFVKGRIPSRSDLPG